ncbi:interleukin-3 receptor subunit alpha [Trichosurus vulpecula]|uniref:interleukin-3 receptor subunit alpha n=1 Tax=Trichosurus vulpecula TaxID=9337 RepID=UPI00186AD5D6|nr:interleukin-3 receptor subunit alpha [Trichosurus vulpecula]
MANLITFLWFSMLLTLTYSQTPTPNASDSPIKNISFDAETMWLRWTNVKDVNDVICSVIVLSNTKYKKEAKNNSACPIRVYAPWCQGVNFKIEGFAGERFTETFQIPRRGKEGITKENVSCQVHDANLMDCEWTVRETPSDIQYQFFYSQKSDAFADIECPKYKTDSEGRRVGCHFNDLSGFREIRPYHFLVTGTSNGTEVQCNDEYIDLSKIEIFKPPNITVECTNTNCTMQWQVPERRETWDAEFLYQLQIQKIADKNAVEQEVLVDITKTNFNHRISEGKFTVKIRTKRPYHGNWSEWSKPQEFGHEAPKSIPLAVFMWPLFGIAFIILIIIGYLCKRYYVIQKILPPVPRVKDQVSDNFHKYTQVVWEENKIPPEQCKIEVIQVIGKKSNCP